MHSARAMGLWVMVLWVYGSVDISPDAKTQRPPTASIPTRNPPMPAKSSTNPVETQAICSEKDPEQTQTPQALCQNTAKTSTIICRSLAIVCVLTKRARRRLDFLIERRRLRQGEGTLRVDGVVGGPTLPLLL